MSTNVNKIVDVFIWCAVGLLIFAATTVFTETQIRIFTMTGCVLRCAGFLASALYTIRNRVSIRNAFVGS